MPVIPDETAVSKEEPIAFVVAIPRLEIVSTLVLDEFHVAIAVKSCVVPSVNVPVAVNCWWSPSAMVVFPGETTIVFSTAGVTLRGAFPEIPPELAVMVALPTAIAFARPRFPEKLILATAGWEEVHATLVVTSRVLPSEKLPVAVNFCVSPAAIEAFPGVICREVRTGREVPPPTAPPPPQLKKREKREIS